MGKKRNKLKKYTTNELINIAEERLLRYQEGKEKEKVKKYLDQLKGRLK